MVNEIHFSMRLQVKNGFLDDVHQPQPILIDQATARRGGHVQNIGTSAELVDFGDVSTNGILVLRNLDPTNFIKYGPLVPGSGGAMEVWGKILPGEYWAMRLMTSVVMHAQADTAACDLDVALYDA
jgi:hypothetical protein